MNNKKHLICVYGSLKRTHGNYRLLEKSKFLGTHITEPIWTLHSLGSFPALTKNGNTSIHTEIFEVDEETRDKVYRLEGYTGERNNPNNWYDTDDVSTPHGRAELFYMKEDLSHRPIVESGVWK